MSNFGEQTYSQIEFRKKISNIRNNKSLSEEEKKKQINDLFLFQNRNENKNFIKNENKKECEHYPYKKCGNFHFSCCDTYAECIRCHNEKDLNNKHIPKIDLITCKSCSLEQPPSEKCIKPTCNIKFSRNYCGICNIWSEKDMYHCKDCELCISGKEDTRYHCHTCNSCFETTNSEFHRCVNISYREQVCGYCLKNIYNSQDKSIPLSCDHIIHESCYKNALHSEQYKCPLCKKSICSLDWSHTRFLISNQPMPEENIRTGDIVEVLFIENVLFIVSHILDNNMFKGELFQHETNKKMEVILSGTLLSKKNKKVEIYCNDCSKKGYTTFHYLGNECMNCNSFNTSL
jgi:RING finger/CHY zinc finger protein 1